MRTISPPHCMVPLGLRRQPQLAMVRRVCSCLVSMAHLLLRPPKLGQYRQQKRPNSANRWSKCPKRGEHHQQIGNIIQSWSTSSNIWSLLAKSWSHPVKHGQNHSGPSPHPPKSGQIRPHVGPELVAMPKTRQTHQTPPESTEFSQTRVQSAALDEMLGRVSGGVGQRFRRSCRASS